MTETLPPDVSATLGALLTGGDPVSSALRAQIAHARVVGRCGCGCASVDLEVDRAAVAAAPEHGNPVADGWYVVPEDAGALVFAERGYLSLLEVYSASGEPISAWPDPRFVRR
ncbi:hypothetical protein ABZ896_43585 [Streptomyces sp. NPDC047072]|uniref:hypothetical protein n=1 Tax=Streptomyces sp. NPDC047072 TaxID=3154809 RepID=UPI0033E8C258